MKSFTSGRKFDNHSFLLRVSLSAFVIFLFASPARCDESQLVKVIPSEPAAQIESAVPHDTPATSTSGTSERGPSLTEQASPALPDPVDLVGGDVETSLRADELRGPGRWFFNTRIGQKVLGRLETGDIRRRPMIYWRRFADKRLPPIGTFVFLLVFNTTICLVWKSRVEIASRCVRKSFWKSLGVGLVFVVLMASIARICFDSGLYTPLALLILGVVEFFSLAGLAVSSRTVGTALMTKLGMAESGQESAQTTMQYLAPVFVGTLLFTLIALLPGLGPLPRLGTRFVMWLSLLGMGALVRTKLGRKELV